MSMKSFHKGENKNTGGYAMLELLFYISFFAAISVAVMSSLVTMTRAFRETALYAKFAESSGMMERLTREIRGAENIITIGAGNLKLQTRDAAGASKTVEFLLSGTDIRLLENNSFVGNLNAPGVLVDSLSFTSLTTAEGFGVKIGLSLHASDDMQGRTFDFFDTVVLRGNY